MEDLRDISETAASLVVYECFIEYSYLFSWNRMLFNIEVRAYEHSRIDRLALFFVSGLFLAISISLFSDSYFGKYNTVFFGVIIGIIQPLFCSVSFLPADIHRPEDIWLLSQAHVKLLEWATLICYLWEGTRVALVLEQTSIPKKQFSVRKFITLFLITRKLAQLLMSLTLLVVIYNPNIYGLFSFVSTTCYGLYINRIMSDRSSLREERYIGFVWTTFICIVLAIGKTIRNVFSKKTVPLFSEERNHYVAILSAKKVMDLSGIGLTVIALSISFHILYQYIHMYTRLFMKSELDYAISTAISAVFETSSIVAFIIIEFVIIPMLEENDLCQTNLQCLKATFVILGAALVSVLTIDCYNNYLFGLNPLNGGGEFRIYNGAQKPVTIKHSQFIKEILPTELFVFTVSFPHENTLIRITGDGMNKTHLLTITLFEAETYIVMENQFRKIKTADPIFKVTPSYKFRPHVNLMVVSNEEFTGNLTVNDVAVKLKGNEGSFTAAIGKVNISINGQSIGKTPTVLDIGRSYFIFLNHHNGLLVNTTMNVLDRHYQLSLKIFWIIFPLVLTIFGRCLCDVSTLCLFYKESPPNLRSTVFSYLTICYDLGIIIQLLHNNIFVKMTSFNIALILCNHMFFFAVLCFISRNYQFRLAHWL